MADSTRIVRAIHGHRPVVGDPPHEIGLAESLRSQHDANGLRDLYARFALGEGPFDAMMRRVLVRAAARSVGHGLQVGPGAGFKHWETFEIGDQVFIGAQAYIQGRFDGTCRIGSHVWIGPQAYLDARDLVLEDYVGWGPGSKVLGSAHTGMPIDIPVVQTDLEIRPVRIGQWASIGTSVVIMPGVTMGQGSMAGAGAVVTKDVPAFAVVAGVPAKFLRWREGHVP